ncbi:unnamed protein product [Brassica oleracea var. botrytis]
MGCQERPTRRTHGSEYASTGFTEEGRREDEESDMNGTMKPKVVSRREEGSRTMYLQYVSSLSFQ